MPKVVLVVDDIDDTREMMKIHIELYGYQVVEAANGEEAVEKYVQYHPDLILMDLALPSTNGASATKIIRKIEGIDKVPIVACTGFDNVSYQNAVENGFDGVLHKPIDFDKLEPLLSCYLA